MHVNLSAELEAEIVSMAIEAGTTPEQMVAEVVADFAGGKVSRSRGTAETSTVAGGGTTTAPEVIEPEVDSRGKILPARHLAGGIITPQ